MAAQILALQPEGHRQPQRDPLARMSKAATSSQVQISRATSISMEVRYKPEDYNRKYLEDLRTTDPQHDKTRIEQTKGGLLPNLYRWVFDNADFRQWRDDAQYRLLWITGDPGKGKTMLLCGIINELKSASEFNLVSFFFC
ncbi:hypothetical protein C7999DRAFT_34629 [Corynascus novoguineensis]|uniref:NACHT domain-containing protein n=1 Tax=Corynascus novoguineensis TaxID=1126955 RepID=A0AAN7CMT4_9PEZI|nr:hypothetical protein C7999DRAFT_34629 [Corynascus novoguineensis]